jgi:hypothetical protein
MELFPIRKLSRNPVRFEGLDLFSQVLASKKLSLRSPNAIREFLNEMANSTKNSLANEAMLLGTRTESMFEMVVASLGKVSLLKKEDAGNLYVASGDEVATPDFRVVLSDGAQLLIEVKNFYQKDGLERFELESSYLAKLQAYSRIVGCDLLMAVYWVRWNLWTLVSPRSFSTNGKSSSIALTEAMPVSQMALLGDLNIGTRSPLQFRLEVNELGSVGDRRQIRIESTKILCAGKEVTDPVERKIAMVLLFYGGWKDEAPVPEMRDGKVVAVDYFSYPESGNRAHSSRNLEMVGFLSSIISSRFRSATSDESGLTATRMDFKPGEFGRLIPEGYEGKALPLLRLQLKPNETMLRSSVIEVAPQDG